MNYDDIYEKIISVGGDCFMSQERPPCERCPFKDDCVKLMVTLAKPISKETRLRWALNRVLEEAIFNDNEE